VEFLIRIYSYRENIGMTEIVEVSMFKLAKRLWPIDRSLTGDGVRETLGIIKNLLPDLNIDEVPSGTEVFDWTVPKEWRVVNAWIITPSGKKICNFKDNNLHLVGYSTPISKKLSLKDLDEHLYTLPNQPTAIPYVTSYYNERWGFCLSQEQRDGLAEGEYEVFIDSILFDGSLTYGELIIPGESDQEIFLSTYVCHPSMANNELSGPVVTTFLAKWLMQRKKNKYTYRIIFIPETIGSITYLAANLSKMKANIVAGFNISCVGDDREYSYLPSRRGDTLSDLIAVHVLKHIAPDFKSYKWTDRGSDERQYCAPHVDLPIASIMRTKYGEYPEYHTSLDTLGDVVTEKGLAGGYDALKRSIEALEKNVYPCVNVNCEPQLGKRGLYPTLSNNNITQEVGLMMDFITWSDGTISLLEIAEICEVPVWSLYSIMDQMAKHDLISLNDKSI